MHDWEGTIQQGSVWEVTCITEANTNINAEVVRFGKLSEAVKINQMPGAYHLGRKDNLYLVLFRIECYSANNHRFILRTLI